MSTQDHDADSIHGKLLGRVVSPVHRPPRSEGARRIVRERQRHFDEEGWTIQGDVENYTKGELVLAAISYAAEALVDIDIVRMKDDEGYSDDVSDYVEDTWPKSWLKKWDKRGKVSVIRCLEFAGALIAAEIDRRLALGEEA
jgi:hypothetical protein